MTITRKTPLKSGTFRGLTQADMPAGVTLRKPMRKSRPKMTPARKAANFRDVLLLADGVPGDLASIAAYGNAIDIRPAIKFIAAYAEARGLILPEVELAA